MTSSQAPSSKGAHSVTVDDKSTTTSPPLRLVRGEASPEEIAALFAVLSAASGGDDDTPAPRPTSAWTSRERLVRRPLTPGPGAWRASAWR
ncbi:hypothetical protein GCM10009867_35860 [Pedococcus aerophilus]|uniref:Acyl-CoA carboxylase subunit epsilon n=1 Tax=Pedococcus aerophilus TaxID=436356 RepID=A0ABN3UVU9_9MICO